MTAKALRHGLTISLCVVAALVWAQTLGNGLPLAVLLYGSREISGEAAVMTARALAVALPLALLPLGILLAAGGAMWDRRWALPVALGTAIAAVVHLGTAMAISRSVYGF